MKEEDVTTPLANLLAGLIGRLMLVDAARPTLFHYTSQQSADLLRPREVQRHERTALTQRMLSRLIPDRPKDQSRMM